MTMTTGLANESLESKLGMSAVVRPLDLLMIKFLGNLSINGPPTSAYVPPHLRNAQRQQHSSPSLSNG